MPVIATAVPGERDEDDRVTLENRGGYLALTFEEARSLQINQLPAVLSQLARARAYRVD